MPLDHLCAGIQYPVTEDGVFQGYAHSDLCGHGDHMHREHLHTALDEFLDKFDDPNDGYFFVGNPWMEDDNE